MAASKYIEITSAGVLNEVAAIITSAGAGDDGKIVALDATGRLATSFMPVGVAADTATIAASENLAAGDFVNIWDSTGAKVRKADASGGLGKQAHGFVLAGVTSGANASVYFEGQNTQLSALTPGVTYYLSGTTAGTVTATAPTTATHIVQRVGNAVSATVLNTEISNPVVRA